ncbi:MAG: heme exporter protein CcmD [Pseudomonadota bacterium]
MIWESWRDFVAMGGYGLYVWGSMGVVFGALAIELALVRQRGQSVRRELRAAMRRTGGRR